MQKAIKLSREENRRLGLDHGRFDDLANSSLTSEPSVVAEVESWAGVTVWVLSLAEVPPDPD